MIRRFQIEDLIVQDESGVVFRSLDTETGKTVAVRRFFPFGADGGGLNADEQTAYTIAISRLAGLSHPSMRSIIAGGCDPIDGMPFIATEWIEGEALQTILDRGPLSADSATPLIIQALEVCELLSHMLAEEAVWVETDPHTIIVGSAASGRPVTFWISPLKWLGGNETNRGLESIVTLTEELMGWRGRLVADHAGRGLGGWLNWLRKTAATTTLQEARESLAACIGAEPPPPGKRLATRAKMPVMRPKKSRAFLFVNLLLILILGGLGGWLYLRDRAENTPFRKVFTAPVARESAVPAPPPAPPVSHRSSSAPIPWTDHKTLVQNNGEAVVIEGTISDVRKSQTGKTLYLLFALNPGRDDARAGIRSGSSDPGGPSADDLLPFVGKKVRVTGTVELQSAFGLNRPDVIFKNVSAVQIVE